MKNKDNSFVVVCGTYLIMLLAFVGLRIAGNLGLYDNMSDQTSDIIFSILSQVVIMFLIPFTALTIYRKKTAKNRFAQGMSFADFTAAKTADTGNKSVFKEWAFGKTSGRVIGFAILLGLMLFFFNIFVSGFFNGILSLLGYRFSSGSGTAFSGFGGFLVSLVLVAVLPGLCEETAHRGLLLRGMSPRLGIMKAVVFSSLIFGLMHLNIVQFFYAAILGYIMALAVLATRSIWTAVIMHFINNGLSTYFSYARPNGWVFGDVLTQFTNFISGTSILIFAGVFIILYLAIFAIIHMFARENFIKDRMHSEQGAVIPNLKGMAATKYFLTYGEPQKRAPLLPLEKTLLYGIVFLGTVVTAMTMYWGFL